MTRIVDSLRSNPKLLVSALLPAVVLIIIVLATGTGNLFGGGGSSAPPSGSGTNSAPRPPAQTRDTVRGEVSVSMKHLSGHLWRFTYTVRDAGKSPIGGFQLNGPSANLSLVSGRTGWAIFGAGVCHGNFPNMLVYWSTGPGSPTEIKPNETATFSFVAGTTGASQRLYSLSWGQASAQFAQIAGPAPSNLAVPGRCKT